MQVWINQGDIILLSLRDFQDDKADVIVKYTADEARNLKVCFLCVSEVVILPDRNMSRPTVSCQKMPRSTKIPLVKTTRVARSSLRMMAKLTLTSSDGFLMSLTTGAMLVEVLNVSYPTDASCPNTTGLQLRSRLLLVYHSTYKRTRAL